MKQYHVVMLFLVITSIGMFSLSIKGINKAHEVDPSNVFECLYTKSMVELNSKKIYIMDCINENMNHTMQKYTYHKVNNVNIPVVFYGSCHQNSIITMTKPVCNMTLFILSLYVFLLGGILLYIVSQMARGKFFIK